MSKTKAVFVVGPTAAGKTAIGIEIAKRFDGEVVSADSMQIYRGLHIASAAPDDEEKQGIKHHLIEFLPPDKIFSVAEYVDIARQTIFEIAGRRKLPVIVGGTGLYINSLIDHIQFSDEESDPKRRKELEAQMDEYGPQGMLNRLREFDPVAAERLHPNNRRRIIRAFEVYYATGKTLTEQIALSKTSPSPYDAVMIGITFRDREKLYERIGHRVDLMIEKGLLDEAKATMALSVLGTGAAQAIGHKELQRYLRGECSLDSAVDELKKQTRHYAKRQMTWFLRDERIRWIYGDESDNPADEAIGMVKNFL